jgi:hypothetical protein
MSCGGPLQTLDFFFRYDIENGGYGRTYFNIEPYGENVLNLFFSETIWTIDTKLPRSDHWKVLYKDPVYYADRRRDLKHFPHRVQC